MVRAFGYCNDTVDTAHPSRLCRGRERWLDGVPETPTTTVFRTVFSGAQFSDDSARDALRGFRFSGVAAGALLAQLFPGATVSGFAHSGDPRHLPPHLVLEEDWTEALQGGARKRAAVRWIAPATGVEVDSMLNGGAEGFVVTEGSPTPAVADALYLLSGFADAGQIPAELYAVSAIPSVLEHARALILLHLDKHGPAVAIYTTEPLVADETVCRVATEAGSFPVPFAIPPMLARWDRALYELRLDWDAERLGEFPVPPADDAGGRWSARSRRIGNMHEESEEGGDSPEVEAEASSGSDEE
ncbi:MAG: hypothetical protein EXR71_16935 [Myxococcales bacterium]|nr:hypothetical protein [Myxococcales bacterium]